jgi:uncharacterized membrane protein YhhN
MTPLALALVAVACVAAAVDWFAVATGRLALERVAKPAVLLTLLAVAVVYEPISPAVRPWLIAALAASLAGDVLLLPGGPFTAGLVAFLIGQLSYLGAFAQLPGGTMGLAVGVAMGVLLIAVVGRVIIRGAARNGFALPVAVYLAAISGMAISATRTEIPLAALGAWLFVTSDATLGWDRFAAPPAQTPREATIRRLAVITTYHVAQVLLVLALAG